MKRLIILFSIFFMATSCFDVGPNRYSGQLVCDFEYKNAKFNADSTLFETLDGIGIGYDVMAFYHQLSPDNLWFDGGFMLSCQDMPKSMVTEGLVNTYRANLVPAFNGNTYLVYHSNPDGLMPEHDVVFLASKSGTCSVAGCFVTNTVEVATAVAETFEKGDELVLKATGYNAGAVTGTAEMTLAEFSNQKDSIVSTWTAFNLAKLGTVECVDFEITSTKEGIPAYFCMDNFIATIELEY